MSVTLDLSGNNIVCNAISTGSATAGGAGILIPGYEYATATGVTTTAGSTTIYVQSNEGTTYQVVAATVTFSTTSSSGTIQVNVDSSTNAPGAGTAQLSSAMSLAGTANTPVNGTVIASPTSIAAGSRISYTTGGTLTGLAGCVLTVVLKRTA